MPPQTWLYSSTVEKGDSPTWLTFSSFQGFPVQLNATVPARTPETQPRWLSAKQDFLPEHFCWLLLFCVVLFVQEDGQLILEGLLNIYWGLRRPIRLQMFDDNERFRLNRLGRLIHTSYRGLNGLNWEEKVMWEQCSLVKTWKSHCYHNKVAKVYQCIALFHLPNCSFSLPWENSLAD